MVCYRDKAGRSVPAPGRGALSIARELQAKHPLPILDVAYRSRQLAFRRKQISQWLDNERQQLQEELEFRKAGGDTVEEDYVASRITDMEKEAARQEKDALATYGMLEGVDPRVAPLRRALAVWGLTADDIGVLSIHGTSTGANVCISGNFNQLPITNIPSVVYRRRTRLPFGTTSSPTSGTPRAMRSRSWRRRASAGTPRAVLRRGSLLGSSKVSSLRSFPATATPSKHH